MTTSRREFVQWMGLGGATAALAGCDAAVDQLAALFDPAMGAAFQPPSAGEIDAVSHALNRMTWGAAPREHERVSAMGIDAFLDEQLDPASIRDRRADWRAASIESIHEPIGELYDFNEDRLLFDLTRHKLVRAVFSRRQLYEVMVDFWTDHLNIVSSKGDCQWLKVADDRDVVRAHALGRFRDLIRASATSPAMLIYLDGHDNKVEHPGEAPNENYARELLELHTLGVHGGYTQQDVMEVARCLSGWTYENAPFRFDMNRFSFSAAKVEFDPARHDTGSKNVLGVTIPTGGGADDLERVLDIVCAHPSTARYIATKLCRRFIGDEPDDAAVGHVADAFSQSGGDIKVTLRALFGTDAFQAARGGLFKRPFRFVVSALRTTDAATDCGEAIMAALARMGHSPFQYPTPDGYPMEAAPWMGTLLWRWNFALELASGSLSGSSVNEASLAQRAGGGRELAAHVLGRQPAAEERGALNAAPQSLALLLASPAFQYH